MSGARPTISTHVLDTQAGRPAQGVPVRLVRVDEDGTEVEAGSGTTDADGRIGELMATDLTAGRYRLHFDVSEHGGGLFVALALDLDIADVTRTYHVPLLLAPFAMTTYRGS